VESRVAICLERCPEMVIAILGAWKAGAAYVPLDPRDPRERLAALVEGDAIDVMIVHEKLLGRLPEQLPPLVLLDLDAELIALENDSNLDLPVPLEALAYIIHTSGSTGVPKGVMIQHGSLANLVEGLRSIYQNLAQRRLVVGLNAPLVFDSSVKQLLALSMGHTLCVVPEEARRNGDALLAYAKQTGIEALDCTPTMAQILIEVGFLNSLPAFSLFLGGEAVPPSMWQALADSTAHCFNLYGPTECTVDATACALDSRAVPAIGRALAGTNVYVLDERMEPVPTGTAGEIYVGGLSVGRGYLNRPEMTAERFLPDSFSKIAGARMYRSGDRARYSRDGNFEFIGRVDRQVKVRGFRIELGEIESRLRRHSGVRESAVVLRTDTAGIKRLIGYVVTEEQHGSDHYRQFLAQRLPEYMVPALVLRIPEIPMNANGKRDYAALPLPEIGEREQERDYAPPRSDIEKYLVDLWSAMLRTSPIGIADSFFALGGDSLQATRMVAQVQADFATSIPLLALFFQEPTIAALSRMLAHASRQSPVLP
jgi:amino acid adenylation domain-containing protein